MGSHEEALPPPLVPPALPPVLPPVLPPAPPLAQLTFDQSAGTTSGVQPGSLVWDWTHLYVVPLYVTSWPTAYGVDTAHGVAVAHSAALSASSFDCAEPLSLELQPTVVARTAIRIGRVVLTFMPA